MDWYLLAVYFKSIHRCNYEKIRHCDRECIECITSMYAKRTQRSEVAQQFPPGDRSPHDDCNRSGKVPAL